MKRHLLSNLGNFQLNALFSAFALVVILPVKAQTLGVSSKKLEVPTGGETGFERVDPEPSGITFINTLGELTGASNRWGVDARYFFLWSGFLKSSLPESGELEVSTHAHPIDGGASRTPNSRCRVCRH
jgi:hypothetical protein